MPLHWPQGICSFFYAANYYQAIFGDPDTGLSHTWSLAVEEQYYLLWPMTFVVLSGDPRKMARRLVSIIGLLWLYRVVMLCVFHVREGYVYEAFDMRMDHLLIGCLLAVSLRQGHFARLWAFLCSSWIPGVSTLAGLALCSVAETLYGATFRNYIGFVVAPVFSAFFIAQAIAFSGRGLWRVLDWNWMRYLGRISYSIYLYQQLTVGIAQKLAARYGPAAQFAAAIALTILAATGSYFVVERYFLSLKARFVAAEKPAHAAH
jgi:peptidoglycan/LPS O-acetylase OafA/YrhL